MPTSIPSYASITGTGRTFVDPINGRGGVIRDYDDSSSSDFIDDNGSFATLNRDG
jgi:hypothetical protein